MDKQSNAKLHEDGQKELRSKLGRRILVLEIIALILAVFALVVGILNLVRGLYWSSVLDFVILIAVGLILIPLHRLRVPLTKAAKE